MFKPEEFSFAKLPVEVEEYIDNQLRCGNLIFELPDKFYKYKEKIATEYMNVGWSNVQIRAAGQPDVSEYWQLKFTL